MPYILMLEGWKPTLLFFSILESQVSTSYLTEVMWQWQTPQVPHRAGCHENVALSLPLRTRSRYYLR